MHNIRHNLYKQQKLMILKLVLISFIYFIISEYFFKIKKYEIYK